jgi:hypothetical protein
MYCIHLNEKFPKPNETKCKIGAAQKIRHVLGARGILIKSHILTPGMRIIPIRCTVKTILAKINDEIFDRIVVISIVTNSNITIPKNNQFSRG